MCRRNDNKCFWTYQDEQWEAQWETECGKFIDTSAEIVQALRYCPYCEKEILDIQRRGFRITTYGDRNPTHAVCKHGVIVEINHSDHICKWQKLVRVMGWTPYPEEQEQHSKR